MMGVLDRLLNQDSFTEAFDELQKNHKKVSEELETQKAVNKELANDFIKLEQKLKEIEQDPEAYIEAEIEKRTLDLEAEYAEKMNHKWYCIGRRDAYADMGCFVLDLHQKGIKDIGFIVDDDMKVVDVVNMSDSKDLKDVKPSTDGVVSDDEILIDDLVEV
jgi:hypothetical protein